MRTKKEPAVGTVTSGNAGHRETWSAGCHRGGNKEAFAERWFVWPEETLLYFLTSGQLETLVRGSEGAESSLLKAEKEKDERDRND